LGVGVGVEVGVHPSRSPNVGVIQNPYARPNPSNRNLLDDGASASARVTASNEIRHSKPALWVHQVNPQPCLNARMPGLRVSFSHLWMSIISSLCFLVFLGLYLWNRILLRCCFTLPPSSLFLLPSVYHHYHCLFVFCISCVHATIPGIEKYLLPDHWHYPPHPKLY